MTFGSASPEPRVGPYRGRCGRTGEISELRRQPGVKPEKAIACPAADVRQAKQPGHITGIGYLFHRWKLEACLQGGHCGRERIGAIGGIGYGVQQHQVLTVLRLVQVADYDGAAITAGEFLEGFRVESVVMIEVTLPLRHDRLNLDAGVESAEQWPVLFETLTIQREGVREDGLAQLGEPVQRDFPQVRIDRFEFLVLQGHHGAPRRFQISSGKSVSEHQKQKRASAGDDISRSDQPSASVRTTKN